MQRYPWRDGMDIGPKPRQGWKALKIMLKMGHSPKVSHSLFYNTFCPPCEMALTPLTIDVCSEVDFTDIIISDDSFITSVWSIMSCTVIQRTSSRKSWSGFQTILSYQLTGDTLQCLTEIQVRYCD